MTKDRK